MRHMGMPAQQNIALLIESKLEESLVLSPSQMPVAMAEIQAVSFKFQNLV